MILAVSTKVKTWMEYEWLLLRVLHYTDAKMCLSGQELNNDGLGHSKHRKNVWILLGWVLEGRVGRLTGNLHFFYFAKPLPIEFTPQHPQTNLLQPSPHLIQIIYDPLTSQLNYYI